MSLDGFVAGPKGEMGWINLDSELYKDATKLKDNIDTAIYGRVVYYMMKNYWPTVLTQENPDEISLNHAKWVEGVRKIVFSKTINEELWNNTIQIKDNIKEEVTKMKNEDGKDMMIFGSPSIVQTFINLDLLDEFKIYLNPVVLGKGIPMFANISDKLNLKLKDSHTYSSGVIKLIYEVKR